MDPSLITESILGRTQGPEVGGWEGSPDSPTGRASPLQGRVGQNRMGGWAEG